MVTLVGSPTYTTVTADGTSHPINMPAAIGVGNLLLVLALTYDTTDNGISAQSFSGFTAVRTASFNGIDDLRCNVWARVADGSEAGTTVDLVTASSVDCGMAIVLQYKNWHGAISGGCEAPAAASGATSAANPPANTWSWGNSTNLILATRAQLGEDVDKPNPANYADVAYLGESSLGTGIDASLQIVGRTVTGTSENPGDFSTGANQWIAHTIAIRDGSAGSDPGTVPSVSSGPIVDYGDFTRAGPNNTPWSLSFTPSDADTTGADALTWQVRTATGGGGTLVASGTCTHNVAVTTDVAYNASGLVNGNQTLYLRLSDGSLASDTAFTLKRDDDAPEQAVNIEVTAV